MTVKSTGCLFGDLEAANLVIEDGAVVVGNLRIGVKREVKPVIEKSKKNPKETK
jgi:cytoskeletal protein CcmA (bactofilin family)